VSDPNPAVTDPQSRSLFRSFVLDPALIFARVIDCKDIARAVAEEGVPIATEKKTTIFRVTDVQ
jgi:hypothetical protein